VAALATALTSLAAGLSAQGTTPRPAFEVASVKPNTSRAGLVMVGTLPGGRFNATNVPLRLLLRFAYEIQDFQLAGAPGWIDSDRFDIVATAGGVPNPPIRQMVRALLEDRFNLIAHTETREGPTYQLVLARGDGRTAAGLRRSGPDCLPIKLWPGAPPPPPPPPGVPLNPGGGVRRCPSMPVPGRVSAREMTMAQWAVTLTQFVGRPVVDRTGLQGGFDFDIEWTPDNLQAGAPGAPPAPGVSFVDPNGPSIFTALQEELGLKLEPARGPVEVLVVDRVERPTEN
jgi:uncharacterized protein (TIGR03435 family)